MNTRENAGGEIGGAAAGVNQVPPQAQAAGMKMPINPTGLTETYVRKTLVQSDQDINLQAHTMTAQTEQQVVPRENPHFFTMASGLRDFTRVNPPIYTGSKIIDDLKEEFREVMMR